PGRLPLAADDLAAAAGLVGLVGPLLLEAEEFLALGLVDVGQGVDDAGADALINQELALLLGELEDLAGGLEAADDLLVAEAGAFLGDDLVEGDEAVAVDVGGGGVAGLVGGGGVALGLLDRFAGALLV